MEKVGTGIIFKMVARRRQKHKALPRIVRYVHGEKGTFPAHVGPGERLLITDEPIIVPLHNGMSGPDPVKAKAVLRAALGAGQLRTILW